MFIREVIDFGFLAEQMPVMAIAPFVLPLAMGAAGFLGGLFGKKKTTQKSQHTSTTTPTLNPQFQGLQDLIMPMVSKRLTDPYMLPKTIERQGIRDINRTYDLVGQTQQNNLTARGLGSSPIAAAVDARREGGRASEIVGLQESLPLMQKQFQDQDLATAMGFLNFGRGQTTTGTGTAESSQGGGLSGGISGLANMLGFGFGTGMISPNSFGLGGNTGNPFQFQVPQGGTVYSPILPGMKPF